MKREQEETLKEYMDNNSTNFFDPDAEFFVIDTDNLADIKTRLYGYSVQESGIYEDENLTEAAARGMDGDGCYIYVKAEDGKITLKQDDAGCWGIYLFRQEDYFALSNSFFRLLRHIRGRYPLSIDRDFCNHMFATGLGSISYSETPVREIGLLDKNVQLEIDVSSKSLRVTNITPEENRYTLDSREGMDKLDCWFEKWTGGGVFCRTWRSTPTRFRWICQEALTPDLYLFCC